MRQISMKGARVSANLTQEELAEKMGVSRVSVQLWESGKRAISKPNLIAFCTVTGFSVEDIILPEKYA